MKYKELLRNNLKFILVMLFVIVLGVIGITYAFNMKAININVNTVPLAANITGDENISSMNTMLPIDDSVIDENELDIINGTFLESNILRAQFTVSNVDTNPDNTIYDIALHDIDMDCELKSKYLKWRLYKGDVLLSEGNFSPVFDITIEENRLVLTTTQEDLNSTNNTYTFIMWISEACPGSIDILECTEEMDQSSLLNKEFSAMIKLELSSKNKKNLIRKAGTELICE